MNRRRFVSALAAAPFLGWAVNWFADKAMGAVISGQNPGQYPPQGPSSFPSQNPPPNLEPPTASQGPLSGSEEGFPPVRVNRHAILVQDQKNIRKDVSRLYDLAAKLKKQVANTDSSEVLSLGMLHTADEIQKLAKHIMDLAKG
jgi:hypothetical protein